MCGSGAVVWVFGPASGAGANTPPVDVKSLHARSGGALPRLHERLKQVRDAEAVVAWRAEADALQLQARRLAVDWITPAFSNYLKIPDPEVGSKHWEIGPGYLWPPRQLDPGQQLARMMMANPNAFAERFLAHEAAAGVYLDEGVRRALEDNQRQIAEAEQRQREREEREAAEARKAQEAERAAYYAKHGGPT